MIRQKVLDTLSVGGPMTLAELSDALGIPRATLITALTSEFYREVKVEHPKHGRLDAWGLRPTALRVDGEGRYYLPTQEPV